MDATQEMSNEQRLGSLSPRRSDRPLRARSEWRGGLRPPVRPGSLRSRRPNLRVQLTLRLVHCVPRLAQLTRRAIGQHRNQCGRCRNLIYVRNQ